jgi:hypothetical protein
VTSNDSRSFTADEENKHLRERIVGRRVTNAWCQAGIYVLEFDSSIRLIISNTGVDWFTSEAESRNHAHPHRS